MVKAATQLPLVVLVQILAISCWFNTAAAVPGIAAEYGLADSETSILTIGVQLGFAAGAVALALLRAPDRVQPRTLISCGAMLAAVASIAPVLFPMSFAAFTATRVVIGIALAAVYTAGMRAVMSWVGGRMRGFAVASLVSALTLGTAIPHLVASAFIGDWRQVLIMTAVAAGLAAGLALLVRSGPHVSAVRSVAFREAIAVLGSRAQRRITLAYLGHMWEIYGMWVWLPSFLAAVVLRAGPTDARIGALSFLVIGVAGVGGSLVGAFALRRWTGWAVSRVILLASGLCVILTPVLGLLPEVVAVVILATWGAVVIADSALYSAMTGDESGQAAVGTAIALQMGLGYGLSVVTIIVVPLMAESFGWAWAFVILLPGPVLGLLAMRRPVAEV